MCRTGHLASNHLYADGEVSDLVREVQGWLLFSTGTTEGSVAKNCSSFRRWSLSLKGQTDSKVESPLRKISSVCKKLYKYLPLLLFPTEIILQMPWKIIWTTDSCLNFTSFGILHFFTDGMIWGILLQLNSGVLWAEEMCHFLNWSRGMVRRWRGELCTSVEPLIIHVKRPQACRNHLSISEILDSSFRDKKSPKAFS